MEALPETVPVLEGTGGADGWADTTTSALAEKFGLTDYAPRTFSDIADSPYRQAIQLLATYEVLQGDGSGAFRPTDGLSFGLAIEAAKRGLKIARRGWNGKGQHVELAACISYTSPRGEIVNSEHEAIGNRALAFVGTSGVQMGWLASQADMLADDWMIVE